ncbi:MAG: four helix bundle protein [Armatimonadota bacterium]|nr:four helix bundle protein [bacterium]
MLGKQRCAGKSFKFALDIIRLYGELRDKHEYVISKQLLRSGTSIGANVEEATAAQSRKDFLSKMSIALKEAHETKYWLRLLHESRLADVSVDAEIAGVDELLRILASIVKTTKEKMKLADVIAPNHNS